jgi:hypothetical protein
MRKIFLVIIFLVLLLVFSSCGGRSKNDEVLNISPERESKISYEELSGDKLSYYENEIKKEQVNVFLPVFKNFKNVDKLNQKIEEISYNSKEYFDEALVYETPEEYSERYFYYSNYEIFLNNEKFLSVRIDNIFYTGGAHPNTLSYAINFDKKEGKFISLEELFLVSDYINVLEDHIINFILRNDIVVFLDNIEDLKLDKDPEFLITEDCLIIFFQRYEYTPYSYGLFQIEIPYSEISDINKFIIL